MENQIDVQTESSPVLEVPRDSAAYAEWRQTGKLPEAKPTQPKGESAPPKESSAEGKKPEEKAAPVCDQQIPLAVKAILDQSPVWTDVLYTLGSKPEDLQGFHSALKG